MIPCLLMPNGTLVKTDITLYDIDDHEDDLNDQGMVLCLPGLIVLPKRKISTKQVEALKKQYNTTETCSTKILKINDCLHGYCAKNPDEIEEIIFSFYVEQMPYELVEGEQKVFDKDSGYNISLDELYILDKLKEKYPNIQSSYTDDRFVNPDTHRHFQVDFYDPDSDTFFNYNKHWTHFSEPYNPNDPEHQKDANWLNNHDNEFYKKAFRKWTINDPLKRELAKNNNITYIEWFNLDEFDRWFADPELTYSEYKNPSPRRYDSDDYFAQRDENRNPRGNDIEARETPKEGVH